jgi:hypothetical protein
MGSLSNVLCHPDRFILHSFYAQKRIADVNALRQCTSLHGVSLKMDRICNLDEEVAYYFKTNLKNLGYRTDAVTYSEKVLRLLNCKSHFLTEKLQSSSHDSWQDFLEGSLFGYSSSIVFLFYLISSPVPDFSTFCI